MKLSIPTFAARTVILANRKEESVRITLSHVTGRRAFENVEMIIADDKEICIWQPNVGNKKGSRRTRFERHEVMGIMYVETDERKVETSKAKS